MIAEKLRVYDAGNLAVSTVATGQAPGGTTATSSPSPAISPDGSLIATEQTGSDIGFGLTVYALDGTKRSAGGRAWSGRRRSSWTRHGPRLAFGGAPSAQRRRKRLAQRLDARCEHRDAPS